jgi:hypothetical protein
LLWLLLEVLVCYAALYLMNISSHGFTELVALAGYKYVGCVRARICKNVYMYTLCVCVCVCVCAYVYIYIFMYFYVCVCGAAAIQRELQSSRSLLAAL